jgi:hypothetical protein
MFHITPPEIRRMKENNNLPVEANLAVKKSPETKKGARSPLFITKTAAASQNRLRIVAP